jgi:hypothetical protein
MNIGKRYAAFHAREDARLVELLRDQIATTPSDADQAKQPTPPDAISPHAGDLRHA